MFSRLAKLEKAYRRHLETPLFARLADLYLRRGRVSRALALCQEGCERFPRYPTGFQILSKCYRAQGQFEEARAAMDAALRLDAHNPAGFAHLSAIYRDLGNPTLALKSMQQAARLDPLSRELAAQLDELSYAVRLETGAKKEAPQDPSPQAKPEPTGEEAAVTESSKVTTPEPTGEEAVVTLSPREADPEAAKVAAERISTSAQADAPPLEPDEAPVQPPPEPEEVQVPGAQASPRPPPEAEEEGESLFDAPAAHSGGEEEEEEESLFEEQSPAPAPGSSDLLSGMAALVEQRSEENETLEAAAPSLLAEMAAFVDPGAQSTGGGDSETGTEAPAPGSDDPLGDMAALVEQRSEENESSREDERHSAADLEAQVLSPGRSLSDFTPQVAGARTREDPGAAGGGESTPPTGTGGDKAAPAERAAAGVPAPESPPQEEDELIRLFQEIEHQQRETRAASRPNSAPPVPDPESQIATVTLAEIYSSQGLLERAVETYRQILAQDPDNTQIKERLAALEGRM